MADLRWSSERPSGPGWYWHVMPGPSQRVEPAWESAEVVRCAWDYDARGAARLYAQWYGTEGEDLVQFTGGWWWGPIEPPVPEGARVEVSGAAFVLPSQDEGVSPGGG